MEVSGWQLLSGQAVVIVMMSEDRIVLSFHDSLIRESDIKLIVANDWLNDSIITFWFEYLSNVKYSDVSPQISFMSPEVVQMIKSADSYYSSTRSAVQSMLQSMCLTDKHLILMPINDHSSRSLTAGGSHWTLVAIIRNPYPKTSFRFTHMDSMSSGSNQFPAQQIFTVLQDNRDLIFEPDCVISVDCASQINTYDCGTHVMANADAVCMQMFRNHHRSVEEIANVQSVRKLRLSLPDLIYGLSQRQNQNGLT